MNEAALIAELSKPEYASLTHQQAADMLNAKTVDRTQPIPAIDVQRYATINGLWYAIKRAANDPDTTNPPKAAAEGFVDWINNGWPLDVTNPGLQILAADLIRFGLLTVEHFAAIRAMANVSARWVDVEGIGECGIGYVINARKAIARSTVNA